MGKMEEAYETWLKHRLMPAWLTPEMVRYAAMSNGQDHAFFAGYTAALAAMEAVAAQRQVQVVGSISALIIRGAIEECT